MTAMAREYINRELGDMALWKKDYGQERPWTCRVTMGDLEQ